MDVNINEVKDELRYVRSCEGISPRNEAITEYCLTNGYLRLDNFGYVRLTSKGHALIDR
jgi:hypothetical protein